MRLRCADEVIKDRALGLIIFADYAEHTARLVAGYAPGWADDYSANRFSGISQNRPERVALVA